MTALWAKILSFLLTILAFFGINAPAISVSPAASYDKAVVEIDKKDVTFQFKSNASTGYTWTADVNGDAIKLKDSKYISDAAAAGMVGVGGVLYFTFTAEKAGKATVTFTYARDWEKESLYSVVYEVTVANDLSISYTQTK